VHSAYVEVLQARRPVFAGLASREAVGPFQAGSSLLIRCTQHKQGSTCTQTPSFFALISSEVSAAGTRRRLFCHFCPGVGARISCYHFRNLVQMADGRCFASGAEVWILIISFTALELANRLREVRPYVADVPTLSK
jgi:hypothetical protein